MWSERYELLKRGKKNNVGRGIDLNIIFNVYAIFAIKRDGGEKGKKKWIEENWIRFSGIHPRTDAGIWAEQPLF